MPSPTQGAWGAALAAVALFTLPREEKHVESPYESVAHSNRPLIGTCLQENLDR